MEAFVNKVAESGIITFDLAPYIATGNVMAFDLKPFLFREMILREKDYRAALPTHNWQQYEGKEVAIFCSADAIVPVWAYMLAVVYIEPIAHSVYYGTTAELEKSLLYQRINSIDLAEFADKRIVIKGCGDTYVPEGAYVAITAKLRPVAKSIMYGEPCSTVPVYKKK